MTTQQKREALDRLYARLPTIQCKKLCQGYCGIVPMFLIEQNRIAEQTGTRPDSSFVPGHKPAELRSATCPLLTADGRCSVYAIRPLICRVYGCTEKLACPHGCKPSRWLSDKEFVAIIGKIKALEARP